MNNVYHKVEWRSAKGTLNRTDGGPYTTQPAAIRACHRIREQVERDGGRCLGWVTFIGGAKIPTVDMIRGEAEWPEGAA